LDGDARDVSGNGNHGTAHGVVWEQDRLGHAKAACQIHGVSHIALPDAALRGLTDFTITAWLRFDTLHRTNPVPYNTFLSIVNATCPKVPGDNEILCGYGVLLGNGFAIEMHGSRPAHQAFDNSRMAEAVWCHVALRRKGEKVSLYLNGRFVSSRPTVSQPLAPAPGGAVLGQEQDRIGGGFDPNQGLDGVVDDLRIYGRALSEEEMVSFRMPMAGEEAVLTNPLDDPRLSDRTRAAMERAVQEARKHGQPVVRSAHLLLSILDGGGVAAEVLRRAGVDAGALRRRVDASVQAIKSTDDDGTPRWSCEAVDAIAFAHLERDRMDHKVLGAEHLLLGLASAPSGMAHMLLRDAGLTAEAARKQVEEIMSPEPKAMADF
jgi:hypothetical protein